MSELPLFAFTLLEQTALGLFVTLVVMVFAGRLSNERAAAKIAFAAFGLAVLACVVSLFHLGRPERAINVLYGLGSSWLSREIVFFGGFAFCVLVFAVLMWKEHRGAAKVVGVFGVVFAVLALVSTSLSYMHPGVPAWNTWATPAQFLLTVVLCGIPLYLALRGSFDRETVEVFDYERKGAHVMEGAIEIEERSTSPAWWAVFAICFIAMAISRFFFFDNIVLLISSLPLA